MFKQEIESFLSDFRDSVIEECAEELRSSEDAWAKVYADNLTRSLKSQPTNKQ